MRLLFSFVAFFALLPVQQNEQRPVYEEDLTDAYPEKDITLSEEIEEDYYKSFYQGYVNAYEVKSNYNEIGHSVWIARKGKKVNAKYFAYKQDGKSIYERFRAWKEDKNIVLACSGAYTYSKSNEYPTGITVDNGNVVNRNIRDDMDALVIVYATGGIVVSDLDNGDLNVSSLGRKLDLRDRTDKYDFLDWAEEKDATVFQSHLLAYKNELRIGTNSDRDRAHRRILTLAINSSGEVYHIVYNIKKSVRLYDISGAILKSLKKRDYNVVAMVNLDTGAYDIIEVYDERNNVVRAIKGDPDFSVRKATNLVTYYYNE